MSWKPIPNPWNPYANRGAPDKPFVGEPIAQEAQPTFESEPFVGEPIILHDKIVIKPNTDGAPVSERLVNPRGNSIEIYQIVFVVTSPNAVVNGTSLSVKLEMGPIRYTNNFVPIGVFDRAASGPQQNEEIESLAIVNNGTFIGGGFYTWRLAFPIIVPPKAVCVPTFRTLAAFSTDVTVDVYYIGRTSPVTPKDKITIPYVSSWIGRLNPDMIYLRDAGLSTEYTEEVASSPTDLINSLPVPLVVDAFVGRMFETVAMNQNWQGGPVLPADISTYAGNSIFSRDVNEPFNSTLCMIRMQSAHGYEIVRDWTPFNLVFSRMERWFPCRMILAPNQYITAELSFGKPYTVAATVSIPDRLMTQIGMIGHAELDLNELAKAGGNNV